MSTVWDKIFKSGPVDELTDLEREQAIRELAAAVSDVERLQASPEHDRILKRIQSKLNKAGDQASA